MKVLFGILISLKMATSTFLMAGFNIASLEMDSISLEYLINQCDRNDLTYFLAWAHAELYSY